MWPVRATTCCAKEVELLVAHQVQAESFIEAPVLEVVAKGMAQNQAQSLVGRQVGPYKIHSLLGVGGMGEVYLAQDPRLDRDIALKILPTELASDLDRIRRFTREAKAASALKHPNVATIYEIGKSDEIHFIAMEYVEGKTLAAKITGRPLPIAEIVDIGIQVADALDEAHRKGITHRDIKPANLMLTSREQVKILDFGLAKVVRPEGQPIGSAISTVMKTEMGLVMGTVQYMSPEQVLGKEVDHRSDIFSLGVVLYEMATGRLPFTGTSSSETMDRVLHGQPAAIARFNYDVPAELERIIRKCLEKDRERRYQSARDLLIDLKNLKRDSDSGKAAVVPPSKEIREERPTFRQRRQVVPLALALVAVVAAGAWLWLRSSHPTPASRSDYVQLTNFPDSVTQPALSADGRMLTFIRGPGTFYTPGQIYVKLLPDGEPVPLTSDNSIKMSPACPPDGSRIAYTVVGERFNWDTWVVPVLGGHPTKWLPNASGLVWMNQSLLLFSEIKKGFHMAIVAAEESRMNSRDVYVPANESGMGHRSYPSPDGKWVLVVEMDERSAWVPCRLVPMDGGSAGRRVGPPDAGCTFAAWSPDGKWMYFSSAVRGTFHTWRQRFPDGQPEQITSGPTEEEGIAMAPDGHSFVTSVGMRQRSIRVHTSSGEREISLEGYAYQPRFSPDGKRLYYRILKDAVPATGRSELWVADTESGRNEPLLPRFLITSYDLSADGKKIVMSTVDGDGKEKLWVAPTDRRSGPKQIPGIAGNRPLFGPADEIFFYAPDGPSGFAFRVRENGTELRKVTPYPINQLVGVSPDFRWLVVLSPEAGEEETSMLLAHPVEGGLPVRIVAQEVRVRWSLDGRLIFLQCGKSGMGLGATGRTYVVPLPPGRMLPEIPAAGFRSEDELARLAGVQIIDAADVAPGPTPEVYAYSRETVQRNLYRIPLP